MKKMIFVLAVLLMTVPAMAGVVVTATKSGNEVTISYDANGTGNIRAFAIDFELTGGTVTGISQVSSFFDIFPGTVTIWQNDINDAGSPIAPATDPGAKGGLGTAGVTLEMGSLYDMGVEPGPAATGVLCKLTISGGTISTFAANTVRGGVVMENTAVASNAIFKIATSGPACWTACQLRGDANMSNNINIADLGLLKAAWLKNSPDPLYNECADFNRSGGVNIADLGILKANWLQTCTP